MSHSTKMPVGHAIGTSPRTSGVSPSGCPNNTPARFGMKRRKCGQASDLLSEVLFGKVDYCAPPLHTPLIGPER